MKQYKKYLKQMIRLLFLKCMNKKGGKNRNI